MIFKSLSEINKLFSLLTSDRTITFPDKDMTVAGLDDLKEIGVGQTWQDVTASRALGTNYTNSTGKPILVNVGATTGTLGQSAVLRATINSIVVYFSNDNNATYMGMPFGNVIVPLGATYQIDVVRWDTKAVSNGALQHWSELR